MIKLDKLYSTPKTFTPIEFHSGVNLILGERSENNKTNGVGKSVCIEFINFCLLKDKNHSRVLLIDDKTLARETVISLDMKVFGKPITIHRSVSDPDKPSIEEDGRNTKFSNREDALEYLNDYVTKLTDNTTITPSFRELVGPLIRDEKSEFQNILKCYDIKSRAPDNLIPHLYLLGLDLALYKEVKSIIDDISKSADYIKKIKKNIFELFPGQDLDSARSELNSLNDQLDKMNESLEDLKNIDNFNSYQDEIISIENKIDGLKNQRQSIKSQIKKIQQAPKYEGIESDEIESLFNQFKTGLGSHLKKTIDEVHQFKEKIDDFQSKILTERLDKLNSELGGIEKELQTDESRLTSIIKLIGHEGILRNLKNSLSIYNQKSQDASKLRSLFIEYDEESKKKKKLGQLKTSKIVQYDLEIEQQDDDLLSFEETILDIHDSLMGNKKASFKISTIDKSTGKEFVKFDFRIDDDGSHSVDRTKVFIYDVALLTNSKTSARHPRLLIHDNIFDVDQDTLIKSLNYLNTIQNAHEFQYILTLNRDKIENEEQQNLITLDIDKSKVASYSKENRFLNKKYQEKSK